MAARNWTIDRPVLPVAIGVGYHLVSPVTDDRIDLVD